MIKIKAASQDDISEPVWYIQFYAPDSESTVRLAYTIQTLLPGETPQDWVDNNPTEAQALIDAGITNAFTVKQEAKIFFEDNPGARQLIDLGPDDLEVVIENRTANQETLLLKALSFAIRLLYAEIKED